MTMRYLARDTAGRALVGDEAGFVPLGAVDPDVTHLLDALPRATDGIPDPTAAPAERTPAAGISFGPPIPAPPAVWGIGLNYAEHAADLDEQRPSEPASFLQPPDVVTGPGGPIRLPPSSVTDRVTAEAELGVVIGRTARDLSPDSVGEIIAGFVPIIDVTAEDILERNPRFLTRSKSFDTFLVMGPWIARPADGSALSEPGWQIRTLLDGDVIAENTLGNAQFTPAELVASLSRRTTLRPGTVIATGTPGAGEITAGTTVTALVDPIGELTARVSDSSVDRNPHSNRQ